MSQNPQEAPYSEAYDDGVRLLNKFFGLKEDNQDYELIKRSIYKDTDCGAWIDISDEAVRVGSIVEGSDFGTMVYCIPWTDLTEQLLSDCIDAVEDEADALWTWANETDMECDVPDVCFDYQHLPQEGRSS